MALRALLPLTACQVTLALTCKAFRTFAIAIATAFIAYSHGIIQLIIY
jgi:hypothetical protein